MIQDEFVKSNWLVVGDFVSIKKWIEAGVNRENFDPVGKITKVRRANCESGIMVRVKSPFFKWVDLNSTWVSLI